MRAAAILEGMPDPLDLHVHEHDGQVWVLAGSAVLASYRAGDTAMRNMTVVMLRGLGFAGQDVAAAMGLSAVYVSVLRSRARTEGSAGLARRRGRPARSGADARERARAWRDEGVADAEIGRRLGVHGTTVARWLGPRRPAADPAPGEAEPLFYEAEPETGAEPGPAADAEPAAQAQPDAAVTGPADGGGLVPAGLRAAGPRITRGSLYSRYAGAMLLHAFAGRVDAGAILASAAGGTKDRDGFRFADVALLSVTSICFALGAATTEQFRHLAAADAGLLAGLAVLPDLRTLRPRLAAIADAADPLELQAMFARAMLAAGPVLSGVYYVDDHFVPYTGAKPVGKGWNNKRGRAGRGRAGTHVTAHDGRAVCFVTGQPSGLTVTLPLALAELKKAAPAGTRIMLGFDHGGAYPQVFARCRQENADWVTYRRAPLAVPAALPVLTTITIGGKTRQVAWAEERARVKDYGEARQITLFEAGQVALQILTSDPGSCPAEILSWLKSRWREENFLKYASENYGIDKICDYIAATGTNTKIVDNPARKTANTAVRTAQTALTAAREDLAAMLAGPAITAAAKNTRLIPAAQRKISRAGRALATAEAARDAIPVKLPANVLDPDAKIALLRAGRRGLQMILRLLAHNAEHWLSSHLNAYLQDDDEYRAITRQTIIRGLAGTITYTPRAITVELQQPGEPRVTRALALLLDEINQDPPSMPGDTRPITYQLGAPPSAFNS
ncbi:MAG TPA: hypothetical protein VMV92_43310 [Streptosporangiaceae bacterium]|nr:hypothetical protein [Streptosporangiaceae bacterium]